MTERMRDTFVVRYPNRTKPAVPSQNEAVMNMGDGTFMADNAFKESIPMLSYTPEELGINMDAAPTAVAIAATDPLGYKPYTPSQEAIIQDSSVPDLLTVQQDFYDGGIQFNAEGRNWVQDNAYTLLIGLLVFSAGAWIGKRWL